MHIKIIDKLKMSLRVPMFWLLLMVLTFVHQFDAITNHDGPATGSPPHLATATLDPEELLHGVIPCTCVDIRLCPTLLNSLKHPVSASSAEIRHLQRFTCGFRGFTPFVCCNEMANTPLDRPTPPMSVVTPTPYPYVTHKPRKGTAGTIGSSNGGNSFSDQTPNIPNGDTYVPFDISDFGPKVEPSTTATPSDYDPTEDIAKTFLPPAVDSQSRPHPSTPRGHYVPTDDMTYNTRPGLVSITTPGPYIPIEDVDNIFVSPSIGIDDNQHPSTQPSQYDPTDDIASTFGTRPGVGLVSITTPGTYIPIEDMDNTFVTPGIDQHPSTPPSHYDPTDDIASTFGIRPDLESTDNPSILPESSLYDPTLDDANAFNVPGVQPHGLPDKAPSTNTPTKDILDANGSPSIYSNNNPSTLPSPYDHTDDSAIPFSARPGVDTSHDPPTVSYPYDPTDDIAKTFGSPTIHSNNNPSTEPNIYDAADDITKTFGTRLDLITTEPPSYYDSRDNTEHTYGSPGKSVPSINTVGPLIPNQHRPMKPITPHVGLHKNLTEFKFHLETKDPSGNITIHLNRLPFQGNRKSYNIPTVTEIPPVTVNYNLQFQPTNMEKKYLQFKDLFYKNLNASKGYPDMKSNNNFYHPYYGNRLLITSPQFRVNQDQDRRYETPNADNPFVLHYLLRAPRSTSTNRYVRQYDPSDYYRFSPRNYYPHFSATTNPHFPMPANHPYYAGSSSKKASSTYPDLNYKPTSVPDYDYSDEEPVTAKPNQYGHHRLHDRGVGSGGRGNEGRTPPRRKPARDEGAIVFPDDSDDEIPNRFQHYQPHANSAYHPGHSHGSRHPAWRPHYPQWGFNHGHYHNPDYHHYHNSDFDSDEETTPKTVITVTTLPPAAPRTPVTTPVTASVTAPVTAPTTTPTTPPTPMVASLTSVVVGNTTAAVAGSELVTKIAVGSEGRQAKRQLLPGDACGVSVDERIIGGKAATLGAYPWIARIGYLRNGSERVLFRCAGTLINSLYVITAAHCISNLPVGLTLASVRLGEVDEAQDPDCRGSECADPVQDFAPARITVHAGYDTPQFKNDVGLIRLDRAARVSTYVSPICLPLDSLSSKNYTGLKATVAGWGASNVGAPSANPILQWVRLTVAPLARCAATFATRSGVSVGAGQLCAGGERGRDSCEGDSGGPLMRPEQPDPDNSPRYFLIGIVSFGAKRCGSDNMPGVYTNVGSYVDWILDNILA